MTEKCIRCGRELTTDICGDEWRDKVGICADCWVPADDDDDPARTIDLLDPMTHPDPDVLNEFTAPALRGQVIALWEMIGKLEGAIDAQIAANPRGSYPCLGLALSRLRDFRKQWS